MMTTIMTKFIAMVATAIMGTVGIGGQTTETYTEYERVEAISAATDNTVIEYVYCDDTLVCIVDYGEGLRYWTVPEDEYLDLFVHCDDVRRVMVNK